MVTDTETLKSLQELQEDIAEYFCEQNFPLSGELYRILVQTLATAKLHEMKMNEV